MLPPKDDMNSFLKGQKEQQEDRFKRAEERPHDPESPRMNIGGGFGPPEFEETEGDQPSYLDEDRVDQAWQGFDNQEVNYENDDYEIASDDAEHPDDEDMGFTPPPKWTGVGEYPRPESMRQEGGDFLRDEPLFEGGPSKSEVNSWKKQIEDEGHTLHLSELSEQVFIWRTLSRTEYREIMALPNTDPLQREEIICEVCVLFPPEYNFSTMANKKAGTPAVLAEQIMHESDFRKPSPPIRL